MKIRNNYAACKSKLQVYLKFLFLSLSILFASSVIAQQSLNASGGDANGTSGNVSYSIGQLTCTQSTGTNGSVSEGVQQTFVIEEVESGIEDSPFSSVKIKLYPNPTSDQVTLKFEQLTMDELSGLEYQLFKLNGDIVKLGEIISTEQSINFSNEVTGIYMLKITKEKQHVKTYRIIKN